MSKEVYWNLCKIIAGILIVLSLSPVVIPKGVHEPSLMGLPYTLWVGIVDALLLVGLTWIGTKVHPGSEE